MINRSEEDWLTISGLKRLTSTGRSWQTDVRKQVSAALRLVAKTFQLQIRFEVLHVYNPIRQRLTGPTLYHVRLNSVEASKALRDSWSGFFRRSQPAHKPPGLLEVSSIRNKVTLATRVRVEIMRELASNYHQKNPGSSFTVKGYDSRPSVVIVPPPSAKDPRAKTYHYMEAIQTLPVSFNDENLVAIFKIIGMKFPGQLSSTFVVLCDDDRDRAFQLVKDQRNRPSRPRGRSGQVVSFAGATSGFGSGMDLEANFLSSVRNPPPPPPTPCSQVVSPVTEVPHSRDRSDRRRRSSTRSASPLKRKSARSPSPSRKRKRKSGSRHKSRKSRRHSSSSSSSGSSSDDSGSSRSSRSEASPRKKKKGHK